RQPECSRRSSKPGRCDAHDTPCAVPVVGTKRLGVGTLSPSATSSRQSVGAEPGCGRQSYSEQRNERSTKPWDTNCDPASRRALQRARRRELVSSSSTRDLKATKRN